MSFHTVILVFLMSNFNIFKWTVDCPGFPKPLIIQSCGKIALRTEGIICQPHPGTVTLPRIKEV